MIKKVIFVFFIILHLNFYSKEVNELEKYKKKYDPLYIDVLSSPESIDSLESIRLDLAEYVYPVRKLLIKHPLEKYKYQTKPILIDEKELISFSDEDFLKATRKKKEFKIESIQTTNKRNLEIRK